jgi:hypothetical protein
MHGRPVIQTIHALQGVKVPSCRAAVDCPVPEALVAATSKTVMRTKESIPVHPRIRWLVQEALKGLAVN